MIKFLTQQKTFILPNGNNILIEAIGVSVEAFDISNAERVPLCFHFFTKENDEYIMLPEYTYKTSVYKNVTIPNLGDIDFISGLVSYDKTKVYQVASIFAARYSYTLLPFAEQTYLNEIN